jgi:hypothetical protein
MEGLPHQALMEAPEAEGHLQQERKAQQERVVLVRHRLLLLVQQPLLTLEAGPGVNLAEVVLADLVAAVTHRSIIVQTEAKVLMV